MHGRDVLLEMAVIGIARTIADCAEVHVNELANIPNRLSRHGGVHAVICVAGYVTITQATEALNLVGMLYAWVQVRPRPLGTSV